MVDILYEDNHIICANKPASLVTQPTENSSNSLEEQVKQYIKEKYQKPGAVFLHAVHRLDKAASGIVLFARTSKALSRLNEQLRAHEMKKEYLARVTGYFEQPTGELVHFLLHEEHKARVHPSGKKSHLFYKELLRTDDESVLHIRLTTGRYHQIRAQLSASHHPIIGDSKYGSKKIYHNDAICLHHWKMTFSHPVKQEPITVETALPAFATL